jgi:hypothetical protein
LCKWGLIRETGEKITIVLLDLLWEHYETGQIHTLRFLHVSDNRSEPDRADESYDQLWKMRTVFDRHICACAAYYI